MPLVSIKVAQRQAALTAGKKEELIEGVTRLIAEVLDKRPQDVVVLIEELNPDNWGQGGQSATKLRLQRGSKPK